MINATNGKTLLVTVTLLALGACRASDSSGRKMANSNLQSLSASGNVVDNGDKSLVAEFTCKALPNADSSLMIVVSETAIPTHAILSVGNGTREHAELEASRRVTPPGVDETLKHEYAAGQNHLVITIEPDLQAIQGRTYIGRWNDSEDLNCKYK